MGYSFPDAENALQEVLGGMPNALPVKTWLNAYDASEFHVLTQVGGTETGPLRMDRIQVDTYAAGRGTAKERATSVKEYLVDRPHWTAAGMLDSVDVEVLPRQVPIITEQYVQYSAIYRVHTRPVS